MAPSKKRKRSRRMAPPPPPQAAKCPTTVLDLHDDLLREVFLRLPALPSLVRSALSCRPFLCAVSSCPYFRRRFRELHPSPFVGLFIQQLNIGLKPAIEAPYFDARHCHPDPDFEAAVRGGDFSLNMGKVDEEEDSDDDNMDMDEVDEEEEEDSDDDNVEEEEEVWVIDRCCDGYVVLYNQRANQTAAYNPLTKALHVFPTPPEVFTDALMYEFYIISSQEDPRVPPRLVCFFAGFSKTVVGLISSDSSAKSEWLDFPSNWSRVTGKMVNGSVYWTHMEKPYIIVLDTTTLQFAELDLPPLLLGEEGRERAFVLGNTKDGRPCIVSPDLRGGCSLDVFFWRRDDEDYLNYWMQTFPLETIRQFIRLSEGDDELISVRRITLMDVIDGIVYLRTKYKYHGRQPRLLLLSFCLETAELKMICPSPCHKEVYPYVMAWPPSLVLDKGPCSKDEALSTPGSEGSGVKTGGGPTPTEPASVAKA